MTTTARLEAREDLAVELGRQGDDRIETGGDACREEDVFDVIIFLDGKLGEDCFVFGNQAPPRSGAEAGMNSLPDALGEDSL